MKYKTCAECGCTLDDTDPGEEFDKDQWLCYECAELEEYLATRDRAAMREDIPAEGRR